MKKLCKWFWMLSKRLYKKATFLVILAAIPLGVLALSFAAGQQGGFLKIVLAQHDPADPPSSQIIGELLQAQSLIQFTLADSPEAALKTVTTGGADCAWIFPADMQAGIDRFVENKSATNALVHVVERETTVFSRLALEKLTSAIYTHCARSEYLRFIRVNAHRLAHVPEAQLLEAYDAIALSEELFTFANAEGAASSGDANYLTAPIRGLLAILVCLCGGAAAAYYLQDRENGTFSLVKEHWLPLVAFGCIAIAVVHVAAVSVLALGFAGLLAGLWQELAAMLLYILCCAGFWLLMIQLLPSVKWLCATTPILVLTMVVLCPVFFRFTALDFISHLLPPTYFVNAAYNSRYLFYLPGYTLATLLAASFLHLAKTHLRRYR